MFLIIFSVFYSLCYKKFMSKNKYDINCKPYIFENEICLPQYIFLFWYWTRFEVCQIPRTLKIRSIMELRKKTLWLIILVMWVICTRIYDGWGCPEYTLCPNGFLYWIKHTYLEKMLDSWKYKISRVILVINLRPIAYQPVNCTTAPPPPQVNTGCCSHCCYLDRK